MTYLNENLFNDFMAPYYEKHQKQVKTGLTEEDKKVTEYLLSQIEEIETLQAKKEVKTETSKKPNDKKGKMAPMVRSDKDYDNEVKLTHTTTDASGEIINTKDVVLNPGDAFYTRVVRGTSIESYKEKQKLDEEMKDFIEENEGGFVHLIFKYGTSIFKELEEKEPGNKNNIHVVRFIMLATCQTFGGKLFDSNKNRVKKSSLKNVWDVKNRNSINETYDILKECGYIYETEDGFIMINEDMIVKGGIKKLMDELKKEDANYTCTRIFTDTVKDMYYGTEQKQRKLLANLIKILPYVNYKFNVFCTNPTETDEKQLDLLNWTDLARICGYDETNVARFKRDLMKLKIYGCDVIGRFIRSSGESITINPKVYYAGDDANDVLHLYRLFNMNPKK